MTTIVTVLRESNLKSVSDAEALGFVAEMNDGICHSTSNMEIWSGSHPDHGDIVVIIPALGEALLILPV